MLTLDSGILVAICDQIRLEAAFLHHEHFLLTLHFLAFFALQICLMHQPVLDRDKESRVMATPRKIHRAIRRLQASMTRCPIATVATMHAVIQSICRVPAPSRRNRPSIRLLLQLRSERAVLLDILYLLLCLRLVSQLLRFRFGLCEPAPPLLTRLHGLGLGLFSGVDSRLECALLSKPFIGLSDELDRFLS